MSECGNGQGWLEKYRTLRTLIPTSSYTSRSRHCSSVSPGSTKPAKALYMSLGNRGARAKSKAFSRRTSPITAGASRGYTTSTQPLPGPSLRCRGIHRKLGRETMLLAENPKILCPLRHHTQSIGVIAMGKCSRACRSGHQKVGAAENEPERAFGQLRRGLNGRRVVRRRLERHAHGGLAREKPPDAEIRLDAAAGPGWRYPSARRPSSISRRRNRRSSG